MTGEDFKLCRRSVNEKTTKEYLPPAPGEDYPSAKLPLGERWSARHFELKDVLEKVNENESYKVELDWFSDISNWSGYRNYLASNNIVEVPEEGLTKPHIYVKLPYTERE